MAIPRVSTDQSIVKILEGDASFYMSSLVMQALFFFKNWQTQNIFYYVLKAVQFLRCSIQIYLSYCCTKLVCLADLLTIIKGCPRISGMVEGKTGMAIVKYQSILIDAKDG